MPGVAASISMPAAIIAMVRIIAGLRPARSAKAPMTMPPTGRVAKPMPKMASDDSRLAMGSLEGKNVSPMEVAKKA